MTGDEAAARRMGIAEAKPIACSSSRRHDGFRFRSTHPTALHTHLRALAAQFARALPNLPPSKTKRAQGRPGADLAPAVRCAKGSAGKPHSSIQVVPITRPSLRSGLTAYAVLSREPSSCWPPSPRKLTMWLIRLDAPHLRESLTVATTAWTTRLYFGIR